MALILNIDTSMETAGICLSLEGNALLHREHPEQKDHAAWLHNSIRDMLAEGGYRVADLQAVAVTAGPGSYTGLRVGMAAAKGLCYALKIPLITESSLTLLAFTVQGRAGELRVPMICPMIDARRMEVFAALYTKDLEEILPASAMVLDEESWAGYLDQQPILFTGSGCRKWLALVHGDHILYEEARSPGISLAKLAEKKFNAAEFTDIVYSEPVYIKEFYTHTKK